MFTRLLHINIALAGLLGSSLAAPAVARHMDDVDLEDLDAEMRPCGHDFKLKVEFEVEVEFDGYVGDLVVVLHVRERRGAEIVEVVVPLDRPTEIDDDEVEFKRHVTMDIPRRRIRHPRRVEVVALVVDERTGSVYDEKDERVDYRDRH